MKKVFVIVFSLAAACLFACAPRVAIRPIPADTPPEQVLKMALSSYEGIRGLKASVKVTVQAEGKATQGFDGVLYVGRPDRVRLTGLAFMGFTAFDVSITGGKFYFYQPSDGYLYTGRKEVLRGFLKARGVDADPEIICRALFLDGEEKGRRFLVEKAENGYGIYIVASQGDMLTPLLKAEFDRGLDLVRKIFYDELARPYLYVTQGPVVEVDGFRLPGSVKVKDARGGFTVTVRFEKYLVNPVDLESDFTIQGGELKGIREVQ